MKHPKRHITPAIILIVFHLTTSNSAKTSTGPVHEVFEVINEQARIDDKRIQTNSGLLPYGNPLAGNSQQNAKLHAQNQQAMFNAERVRQHRAQLQRLNKGPTQTDSYMRAYHESQETHQLALEQQQATLREKKPSEQITRISTPSTGTGRAPASRTPTSRTSASRTQTSRTPASRPAASRSPTRQRQTLKRIRGPDLAKIMQDEADLKDKSRNHRSYGSVEYQQYLQPKKYKTVYVTAGPTYDQGVTIKPNGNAGVTSLETKEESTQLFTQAIPSQTQYIYPKQYSQMQQYESAQDIASLNALLKKQPEDQLSELNALIHSGDQGSKELDNPVDLYFYLKDPNLAQHYANSMYDQISHNYASAYMPELKDHTPITEEIDDVEDPNMVAKQPYTPRPTHMPTSIPEDIITNNLNYAHSVEATVATNPEYYIQNDHKPSYEALKYEKPLTFYTQKDTSERYLHHNGKNVGIQHLNEDGTGVSAYGDENLHYAASYEFGYHVSDHSTGNDFGHHESKKDGNTDGHYHVLLPDGRMQNVKYHAGPEGYHADITYDLQKK